MRSRTELLFEILLAEAGILAHFAAEYRFTETRRWRFDFASPANMLAIEIDGGQWAPRGGRHNSDVDREKSNYATAALGWRILHFSTKQVEDTPAECIAIVRMAL